MTNNFEQRIISIESNIRASIHTQESTLRTLAGLRADMAEFMANLERDTPVRVASGGIVAATIVTEPQPARAE